MALIRCKSCGNLASSRSSACPICGAKIESEQPTTTPDTNSATPVVESAQAPKAEPSTVEEHTQHSSQPAQAKTLNDILAERSAKATLNDTHAEESTAQTSSNSVVATPTPTPTPSANDNNGYIPNDSYDEGVRTVEDYEDEIRRRKRSTGGFMLISVILLVAIAILGYMLKSNIDERKRLEEGYKLLVSNEDMDKINELQADILRSNAEDLVAELAKYKDKNDTMAMRYEEALQMLADLESDRNHTLDQLRRYQEEVKTLKGIMRQYVQQIDSLHRENKTLLTENTSMKEERKNLELRADQAEELADELNTKVRMGSVIQTSGIRVIALNAKSNEVKNIKKAKRLRVDFELTANELAEPGEKSIYVCITNPEGYIISPPDELIEFEYEGSMLPASAVRKVDYENEMVAVSIFCDGDNFDKGTYNVDIYIDGRHCGSGAKNFD